MGQDMFRMLPGGGNGPPKLPFPVDIRWGEASVAIACASCRAIDNRGFFVTYEGKAVLVCIKCNLRAIDAYQRQHPDEKIIEIDVNADDSAYKAAVEAIRKVKTDLSEGDALDIAKAVLNAI